MKIFSIFLSASALFAANAAEMPSNFRNGIIMLNEDWFGHASSSMNFLTTDGAVYYNVYKEVNPTKCLGNTCQFGQVFGDRLFVMGKQSYDGDGRTGGRFTAMDANTLEFKGELSALPGGDGRTVCAVSEHKGYIGTSKGLYTIDLDTYTAGTEQLAPANAKGQVQQTGEMIRYGKYLFVCQQNIGVLAVDIATDEVHTIEMPKIASIVVTADGSLYAATSDANAEFVRIDPLTFETENIDIEGSHAIGSPWSTWRKAPLAADKEKNVVYYAANGWADKAVFSYNFDTKEFNAEFFTIPGKSTGLDADRIRYGEGVSVDPSSGNLLVTATESGYGTHYSHNWVYFVDTNTGEVLKEITLDEYYWFPAMMIYPDFDAPEVAISDIEMSAGDEKIIDLAEVTSLRAGNKHLINYSVDNSDKNVCMATLSNNTLTVNTLGNGTSILSVTAEYQGRAKTKKYKFPFHHKAESMK